MSQGTKQQPYTYSLRTAAMSNLVDVAICADHMWFYIVPPKDAISIENLYVHLKIQFESSISASLRKILRIGIVNTIEFPARFDPSKADYYRVLTVNAEADADRIIELKMSLSALLKKSNVRWQDLFSDQFDDEDTYTYVLVEMPVELFEEGLVGKILLWKVDALFTTKGIR